MRLKTYCTIDLLYEIRHLIKGGGNHVKFNDV